MNLLGMWHAEPMTVADAQALLAHARKRQQRGQRLRPCRTCLLQKLIATYWLGEDIQLHYQHVLPLMQGSPHAYALLELITGQLLISQRLNNAWPHLQQGFHLASHLFTPTDYLAVLNRHQELASLPLSDTPMQATTLDELLTTARVIKRMTGNTRPRPGGHDPTDIYD